MHELRETMNDRERGTMRVIGTNAMRIGDETNTAYEGTFHFKSQRTGT